ncbi:helix-turn-helix domain-containing protein [Paenibacillus sp. TRM 82003]|nr:helix-turn-helix domain-containing protein [Kineococcus sp. TRM81007]MCI2240011.1 helix-turn-helix domain-containing protein [Kineococcus sp. TRM81007]MCI3925684.1 helix-turn-helix domain-containing protein [Paenibacillus sp. TRM 82003]
MSPLRVAALEPLSETSAGEPPGRRGLDALSVGRRIRHHRRARGLTLAQLGEAVGTAQSLLSQVENGKREPRLSLIAAVAEALGTTPADLLDPAPPPNRRAALEIELEQAQRSPLFRSLGLPRVAPSSKLPTEALEALVALHGELARRHDASNATPEEARRANTEIRLLMRAVDNHLPEIEELAEEMVRAAGYTVGALTHRQVARMAQELGFSIIHVDDLPHSTRTVTDLAHGRIYLPPASIPGGHGLRSLALQAIAHRILQHERPASYTQFLRQRLEINYFAAGCLLPRSAAVEFLSAAKADKDLAVEDFRDAFGVTHEAAAHRLTNLLTSHLGIPVHFLRVGDDGALYRGYENDGVPFPQDASGAIEGQPVCREWTARTVFDVRNRTTENYQYTDTPAGTFWCSSQTGSTEHGGFSITVGVPYAHAKWFRGRDTRVRRRSSCPDASCCRRPAAQLEERWADAAWPSARLHAQTLAPLPSGRFPGVDDVEVYEFLTSHAPRPDATGSPG